MTTVTPTRTSHAGNSAWSFTGLIKSEWIKFWSLRSTTWLLIITLVAAVGTGALTAWVRKTIFDNFNSMAESNPEAAAQMDPAALGPDLALYNLPNAGLQMAVLVLGALAVIFFSSEHSTGMIRSTMTATPKRTPVFFAKAIIVVVVSYILSLIAAVITFAIALLILSGTKGVELSWSTDGVIQGVFTGGLFVAGTALIGLSLGAMLRSSGGAITVFLAMFFALDMAAGFATLIPGEFWKHVPEYIPSQAGGRMLAIDQTAGILSPGLAALVFLGWILVVSVPAIITLKNRDV